jgi:CRISPR/Cas system-associated exonuclease Cas4 (RecB family)
LDERKFRNGAPTISASSIAEQLYCEMKVEQSYVHEEVETDDKALGTALHEELLAMERATLDEVVNSIQKKKRCVVSFPLVAKVGDLTLVGVPDAVVFQNRSPTHILELKTTGGDTNIVYEGQKVQAAVYGLMLQKIGFDCSKLKLVIVKLKRNNPLTGGQRHKFLASLVNVMVSGRNLEATELQSEGSLAVHSLDYNVQEILDYIQQVQGYWLGQRAPIPTNNPKKCQRCEFGDVCPSSQVREEK